MLNPQDSQALNLQILSKIVRAASGEGSIQEQTTQYSNQVKRKISALDQESLTSNLDKKKPSCDPSILQHNLIQTSPKDILSFPPNLNQISKESSGPNITQIGPAISINLIPYLIQNNSFPASFFPWPVNPNISKQIKTTQDLYNEQLNLQIQRQNLEEKKLLGLASVLNANFNNGSTSELFTENVLPSLQSLEIPQQPMMTSQVSSLRNRTANIRFLKDVPVCEPIIEKADIKEQVKKNVVYGDEEEESNSEREENDDEYEPDEMDHNEKIVKKAKRIPRRQTAKTETNDSKDDLQIILSLNDETIKILGYKDIDQSKVYALYLRSDKDVKKFFIKLRRNLSYYKRALRLYQS